MKIPKNNQTVMPYIILENAAGFILFTQKVFGAKEISKSMREENVIMHAEIMIGDSTIMFADATEQFKSSNAGLFVYVENADETFKKATREGATVVREITDESYGRSGGIKDPFGNTWWITAVK
ncbi:MAG: VOC family protein [Ginsengibacter sp.]